MTQPVLIFDFDGVLVDSEIMSNNILSDVLTAMGYPVSSKACRQRFTGINLDAIRPMVEQDLGHSLSEDFEPEVRRLSHERTPKELVVITGAAATLEILPHRRCIASNSGHSWIGRGLSLTGLDAYFAAGSIFSAADVSVGKPSPDLFLHAARSMQADPAQCIVIEDSVPGVQGGVAAGMTVLGFAGASHVDAGHDETLLAVGARLVFADLTELPAVLESL